MFHLQVVIIELPPDTYIVQVKGPEVMFAIRVIFWRKVVVSLQLLKDSRILIEIAYPACEKYGASCQRAASLVIERCKRRCVWCYVCHRKTLESKTPHLRQSKSHRALPESGQGVAPGTVRPVPEAQRWASGSRFLTAQGQR